MTDGSNHISFQGAAGANSDIACRQMFPDMVPLPCTSFEECFAAVRNGAASLAMIPIDNSLAGRVADIHHLLPASGLQIIGEHFLRIEFCLVGLPGASIADIQEVHSHVHALGQCRNLFKNIDARPVVHSDTAGAARDVAAWQDPTRAALSTRLAAEIYGLQILQENVEDADHNTTRFVIMANAAPVPQRAHASTPMITSFVFRVRSVPAALYKALGGFATNKVNITKLESYILDGSFRVAQFYADVEGHPDDQAMKFAFEELDFFASEKTVLGVYPASPLRTQEQPF